MRLIDVDDLMKFPIRIDHYDKEHGNEHFVYGVETVLEYAQNLPMVVAVPVEQYEKLLEMYNGLRENFIDYACSGIPNVAPYCLNKCEECVTVHGWCKFASDKCKGFNPAEFII